MTKPIDDVAVPPQSSDRSDNVTHDIESAISREISRRIEHYVARGLRRRAAAFKVLYELRDLNDKG